MMLSNPESKFVAKRRRSTPPAAESSLAERSQQQDDAVALVESLDDLLNRAKALDAKAGPRATEVRAAVLKALQKHPPGSLEIRAIVDALRYWVEGEEKRQPGLVIPLPSMADPRQSKRARSGWHGHILAGLVYREVVRDPVCQSLAESGAAIREDILDTTVQHVADMVSATQARDPIEHQLVEQMAVQHARFLSLTNLATQQSDLEALLKLNEAADRAANTYRRMALALAEYRNPRPVRQVITQQNNAQQQVVQNNHPPEISESDERTRMQR